MGLDTAFIALSQKGNQASREFPNMVMLRRKNQAYSKYGRMLGQGLRLGYKAYRSYKNYTQRPKKESAKPGLTTQHDMVNVYRRRRMPRYKRKRWVKFVKRVEHVNGKALGTNTAVYNTIAVLRNNTLEQTYGSAIIYGKNGNDIIGNGTTTFGATVGNRDLAALTTNLSNVSKIYLRSAVLDLTLTNIGGVNCEVDIYHVKFWKENRLDNPYSAHTVSVTSTIVPSGGSQLSMTTRGCTPFDIPQWISLTGMKILRKTKVFISSGLSHTYQIRDARNRQLLKSDISDFQALGAGDFVLPGWTQGVIVAYKPVAGVQANQVTIHMGVTRKYCYAYEEYAETTGTTG